MMTERPRGGGHHTFVHAGPRGGIVLPSPKPVSLPGARSTFYARGGSRRVALRWQCGGDVPLSLPLPGLSRASAVRRECEEPRREESGDRRLGNQVVRRRSQADLRSKVELNTRLRRTQKLCHRICKKVEARLSLACDKNCIDGVEDEAGEVRFTTANP